MRICQPEGINLFHKTMGTKIVNGDFGAVTSWGGPGFFQFFNLIFRQKSLIQSHKRGINSQDEVIAVYSYRIGADVAVRVGRAFTIRDVVLPEVQWAGDSCA